MRSHVLSLITLAWAVVALSGCVLPPPQPALGITVNNAKNAEISAQQRANALVVEVRSATGIGEAEIGIATGRAPRDLILRLYLRGLEGMTFAYDAGVVQISVPSTGEPIVRQSFTPTGASAAEAIDMDSPYWMNVGILSDGTPATPAIPLENGHFDVSAPLDFLNRGVTDFTLSWTDFYR